MLGRLISWLRPGGPSARAPSDLVTIDRDEIASLMVERDGLPHVDWGMADLWITRKDPSGANSERLRRGVAGAWLDALREALPADHKRWRHARIEGLAPLEVAMRAAAAADRAVEVVTRAIRPIIDARGVPVVALVALETTRDYYAFTESAYSEEGEFATSGGVYLRSWGWPTIVLPVQGAKHAVEQVIAHEWTHHALSPLGLPLWVEEGLTQMMEERVSGIANFRLDRDTAERQRERWEESGLDRFWTGESFSSSFEDEQERSYELAQMLVRGLLSTKPKDFFAFAKDAKSHDGGESAAQQHLGMGLEAFAERILGA